MSAQFRGAFREFTADSIFSPEVIAAEPKMIWISRKLLPDGTSDPQNQEMIQISSSGVNIVSSADARKNARKSLGIALDLAAQGRRVMYLNTFASLPILRENMKFELDRLEAEIKNAINGKPTANPITVQSMDEVKSLFHIMDGKVGMWDNFKYPLEDLLFEERYAEEDQDEQDGDDEEDQDEEDGGDEEDQDEQDGGDEEDQDEQDGDDDDEDDGKVLTQKIDVLVVNSFEFLAMTYRSRLDAAGKILEWAAKLDLTAIVFTQETQGAMEAGLPVRGPLGLLTTGAIMISTPDRMKRRRPTRELLPDTNVKFIYSDSGNLVEIKYPMGYNRESKEANIDIHEMDPKDVHLDPTSEPFQEALREAKLL
jgi:hypothetical protein